MQLAPKYDDKKNKKQEMVLLEHELTAIIVWLFNT